MSEDLVFGIVTSKIVCPSFGLPSQSVSFPDQNDLTNKDFYVFKPLIDGKVELNVSQEFIHHMKYQSVCKKEDLEI